MAVFARKASGLVKQASLFDAFALGFMNGGIGGGLWTMHSWGLYTFPGGNMVLASIITGVLAVLGVALAWGILGGSMPRSGGDYVYNSRIVHPALGTATSWIEGVFTQIAWMWLIPPLIAYPGISILGGALGLAPETIEFYSSSLGMWIVSLIVLITGLLVCLAGLKSYLIAQRITFIVGMIGVIAGLTAISFTSPEVFAAKWNAVASQCGSASYEQMIAYADAEGYAPATWNWVSTFGLVPSVSWSVCYGFYIGYIGGEIKRPERNILMAQLLSAIVPTAICAWAGYVFENNIGYRFMGAAAYADNEAPEWYTMPFPPNWANMAAILVDNPIYDFFVGVQFITFNWLYVPMSYIVFSRVLFSQGMDLIGPRWFTDLNPSFNSPLKLYVLFFVTSMVAVTHYCFFPQWLGGISIEVLDALTVWGITGIVCMIFPYVKKVRHIWNTSPHKWPKLAVMSGIFSLVLSGIMVWAYYTSPQMEVVNVFWTPVFVAVAVVAVLWYLFWRWYRAREGINVDLAFKELPPE